MLFLADHIWETNKYFPEVFSAAILSWYKTNMQQITYRPFNGDSRSFRLFPKFRVCSSVKYFEGVTCEKALMSFAINKRLKQLHIDAFWSRSLAVNMFYSI